MINIRDLTSDDDISPHLQYVLDQGKTAYIPAGDYVVDGVTLARHAEIVADSNAIIKGSGTMFTIASGGQWHVRIAGGQWQNCTTFLKQTGTSALSNSRFERMRFQGVVSVFQLDASVGNYWRDCHFSNNCGTGIEFMETGQSNANTVDVCTFQNNRAECVKITGNASNNTLRNCWFENNPREAIQINASSRNLVVSGCFFEKNGKDGNPDIHLSGSLRHLIVENCYFTTASDAQTYRLSSQGNTSFVARLNTITLKDGQKFAEVAGNAAFLSVFELNFLNAVGGGDYADRLFDRVSNQKIKYDIYVGSGFVTGDQVYSETVLQ